MCEILNLLWMNKSNIINIIETNAYPAQSTTDQSCFNVIKSVKSSKHTLKWVKLIALDEYWSVHIDVKNVIVFAAMQMKQYYDSKHQPHFFNVEDMINLHLHQEYILSSLMKQNKKLSQQFVKSLQITERISHLTYCLDISVTWKIHNIVSVVHLESAYTNDSYHQSHSEHLSTVITLSSTESEWELECLLWKWTYHKGCSYITEYLTH